MTDVSEVTQEQLDALEAKAQKAEEIETKLKDMVSKEEVEKAVKAVKEELEPQVNPNWAKARATIEQLKEVAKSKGVELNEDGTVKSNPNNVDMNAINQQAREAARGELLGNRLEELLEQYDVTSRGVVKHYYQKLSQGEGVTLQNIGKFVSQAERAAELDSSTPIKRVVTYSGGQGPRYNDPGTVDKSKVEGLANKLGINIGETK